MAITRAQQARQLYRNGKRVGLFRGAQADASAGRGSMSPGTSGGGGSREGGYGRDQGNQGDQRGDLKSYSYDRSKDTGPNRAELAAANAREKARLATIAEQKKLADIKAKAIADKKTKEKKNLSNLGFSLTDKFGNVLKQSSIDRNKVLAMRNLNLMPKGLPGLYGNLISGITGEVPDWAKDFTKEDLMQVATSGPYLSQQKTKADASRFGRGEDLLNRVFEGQSLLDENKLSQSEYERLFPSNITTDRNGEGGDNDASNNQTYIPPIIPKDDTDEDTTTGGGSDMGGLAPRFMGSIFDFSGPQFAADGGRAGAMDGGRMRQMEMMEDEDDPEGGIMDLESGRQMYFLGKLVKKATRAVKKVAKSPLGKAALLYFGGGALGNLAGGSGLAGMFKGAMTPSKFLARSKLSNIFTKGGLKNIAFGKAAGAGYAMPGQGIFRPGTSGILGSSGKLSLGKALGLGLGIPAALDLMGVGKEEEDNGLADYYKSQGINIADIRLNPYKFMAPRMAGSQFAADGGRIGYQEGGDAEPVAKKTMPLLDMDGKEMDLRAEGGFVPLGRMERADDVPARLSKNEFVFTADAVRNAGEGDIDKGAEVMYNMMKNLESGGEVSEESQGLDGARKMFQTSQRLEEVL